MEKHWINEEFKDLNLGDKRLTDRFISTMKSFELRPEGCINRIFKDEAAARKASYRLFSNKNFTTDQVLECHTQMTKERMREHKVVLSIHDSSFFSFNTKSSIQGLGNIGGKCGDKDTRGFIGHYALGVTEQGLPLGIQAMKTWSRAYESEWQSESERWVEGIEEAEKTYTDDTEMIALMDREGDQFQVIYDTHNRGHKYVIRSKHDRMIQGEDQYLSWHMNKKRVLWDIEIDLPKEKISVDATMKFGEVTFNDTNAKTNKRFGTEGVRAVTCGVVEIKEKVKRDNGEQLKWVLFTNLPLRTKEDALRVLGYYKLRWQVENYFKVLKDGCCHVEHSSLRHFERLDKYTVCFSIIAWRMFWMKFLHHTDPDLPAKTILTDIEIEVLRVRHKKIKKQQLTVGEALRLIAMFGGYNNRKNDGPPGNITLWRGFMIIRDRAEYHEELVIEGSLPFPMK